MRSAAFPRSSASRSGALTLTILFASWFAASSAISRSEAAVPVPATIRGIELEVAAEGERLLVFGSQPLRYRVDQPDPRSVVVNIENARLDRGVPAHVVPGLGRAVVGVRAREDDMNVVLSITKATATAPRVSVRGSMLAVEFAPLEAGTGPIAMQFSGAPIAEVVRAVSAATGVAFVFDESLEGNISIVAGIPLESSQALELLDAALLLLGHTALPTPGGARKIVPILSDAMLGPWRPVEISGSDQLVTTQVALRTARAPELVAALEPWLGTRAIAIPAASDRIILAGAESHLQSVLAAVHSLDGAADSGLWVRRAHHRSADDLKALVDSWALSPERQPIRVWSIPRTETLVVQSPSRLRRDVEAFIDQIDRPQRNEAALRVIPLRHRDAADLIRSLSELRLEAGALEERTYSVVPYSATNALLVHADPPTQRVIADLAAELDRPTPQVRLELRLLEITTPKSLKLALDAFVPFASPDRRSFNALLLTPSANGDRAESASLRGGFVRAPVVIPFIDQNGLPSVSVLPRESVIVTAEQREIRTRVLMEPELLLTSADEHELFVGNNIPVRAASDAEAEPLTTQQAIERRDVGLRLRVRPTVTDSGIRVDLALDVSTLLTSQAGPATQVGPTIRSRRIESSVRLVGAETAVIGLSEERIRSRSERGVTGLKDLPGLGVAFRRSADSETVSRLLMTLSAKLETVPVQPEVAAVRSERDDRAALAEARVFDRLGASRFAIQATLRRTASDAELIAHALRNEGYPARVVAEFRDGRAAFGVYLHGFTSLMETARASLQLAGRPMFEPRIVARPTQVEVATFRPRRLRPLPPADRGAANH